MFQEKTVKKEKAGLSEIRHYPKNEYYRMESSVSQDVRVVQCVKLSAEQADRMFQEKIVEKINYSKIARTIIEKKISPSIYRDFFYGVIAEKIEEIEFDTLNYGEEIAANIQMLYEILEDYMEGNWKKIEVIIQKAVNDIRFAPVSVEQEEGESILAVTYHTDELKEFCETDDSIRGTINNLRHHYHGTPQAMKIDGESVLHQHVTGRTALAFRKSGEDTIEIMAYGIKSDSTIKGSGGYTWDMKPK